MTPEIHTLTGAYALDALTDAERQEFEAHLALCLACAQEVRELAETAARMGATCATTPPPGLKTRVMRAARDTRQLAPRLLDPGSTPVPTRQRPAWARHALLAAAAAVIVAVASLCVVATRAERHADRAQATANAIMSVVGAPDAHVVATTASGHGSARLVVSRLRDKVLFVPTGIAPAPTSKTYQAWLIGPTSTRSAGLLTLDKAGGGTALVASGLGSATSFGVTLEPAGGSVKPSTPPLVLLPLPS